MKLRIQKQRDSAITLLEVLVIILIFVVLAYIMFPIDTSSKRRAQRINCVSNLKQIGLANSEWEGDGGTNFAQMSVLVDAVALFRRMSNQLDTPKILICPADVEHATAATNFQNDFNGSRIGYFINPDAREKYPQMVLFGDDNLAINGVAVKSGLLEFPTNTPISWTASRHHYAGNIGYADGSVAEVSNAGLQASLILDTNGTPTKIVRFAIP